MTYAFTIQFCYFRGGSEDSTRRTQGFAYLLLASADVILEQSPQEEVSITVLRIP